MRKKNCWRESKQIVSPSCLIMGNIVSDTGYIEMGPYYRIITSASSLLPLDQSLLDSMEKENEEELKKLDDRLAEAEKIEGESEISDALKARANYLTRIGDKVSDFIEYLVAISNASNPHRIVLLKLKTLL